MVSSRKLFIMSGLIFMVWVGIGIFIYTSSFNIPSDNYDNPIIAGEVVKCTTTGKKLNPTFWKNIDFQKEIPENINKSVSQVIIQSNFITVQGSKVHYLHAINPHSKKKKDVSVLLLHGQAYTSETWKHLRTLQNIAAFGFYPVAIDLPGFGKSPAVKQLSKIDFLNSVIKELNLKNPVIISPSMSGSFSMKFLLKHSDKLAGFIPIAPVATNILDESSCNNVNNEDNVYKKSLGEGCEKIRGYLKKQPQDLSCIKVPTLIVFGEKDRGENSAKLCFLPNSQGIEIPNGSHAAYKSDPDLWHKLLYNFLSVINETLQCK